MPNVGAKAQLTVPPASTQMAGALSTFTVPSYRLQSARAPTCPFSSDTTAVTSTGIPTNACAAPLIELTVRSGPLRTTVVAVTTSVRRPPASRTSATIRSRMPGVTPGRLTVSLLPPPR